MTITEEPAVAPASGGTSRSGGEYRLSPPWDRRRIELTATAIVFGVLSAWAVWRTQIWDVGQIFGEGRQSMLNFLFGTDIRNGALPPRFDELGEIVDQAVVTFFMAVAGTALAAVISFPLGFLAATNTSPHPVSARHRPGHHRVRQDDPGSRVRVHLRSGLPDRTAPRHPRPRLPRHRHDRQAAGRRDRGDRSRPARGGRRHRWWLVPTDVDRRPAPGGSELPGHRDVPPRHQLPVLDRARHRRRRWHRPALQPLQGQPPLGSGDGRRRGHHGHGAPRRGDVDQRAQGDPRRRRGQRTRPGGQVGRSGRRSVQRHQRRPRSGRRRLTSGRVDHDRSGRPVRSGAARAALRCLPAEDGILRHRRRGAHLRQLPDHPDQHPRLLQRAAAPVRGSGSRPAPDRVVHRPTADSPQLRLVDPAGALRDVRHGRGRGRRFGHRHSDRAPVRVPGRPQRLTEPIHLRRNPADARAHPRPPGPDHRDHARGGDGLDA